MGADPAINVLPTVVETPEATTEENLGPLEAGVVPSAQMVPQVPKKKARTPKPSWATAKVKGKAVVASPKKKFILLQCRRGLL